MSAVIHIGDCLEVLKTLEDESVQTCVTSPPYWGLRDYGVDGQLGFEETPEEFVENLVNVFREVRRVLRKDGTLWLNLGDSYNGKATNRTKQNGYNDGLKNREARFSVGGVIGLKPKDLVGIPWRVAFALQADGWYLRQDIIWHKPNPMPESVTDRCTKAHEYIFLFSKSKKYYFDSQSIAEPVTDIEFRTKGRNRPLTSINKHSLEDPDLGRTKKNLHNMVARDTKNKRSVWSINPAQYAGSHFAVFPKKLIDPCILAGSKEGDTVLDPFNGAGTTGLVALAKNRNYIGIELNPSYAQMSLKRIKNDNPMFNEVSIAG